MQLNYVGLVSALLLLTSQSAKAEWAYDAVDALLAPGPSGTVGEPLSAAGSLESDSIRSFGQTSVGVPGPESTPYSGQAQFAATNDQPSTERAIGESLSSSGPQHKSRSWQIDSVPEPSALAMAAVALIFFLLFGRRRRLG
ncbi:MAG: PEP-CTERM sorting domain-containing protein [Planctomycetia bacterium]|nr:PEP-CTERM sorting domain-containing protein [Planctomycetia bacterium]